MDLINAALAILTILFGAIALISPRYAMGALALQPVAGRNDGYSELRAASGGAFVGTGAVALLFGPFEPAAYLMLGAHYAGAAVGRFSSIVLDGAGSRKIWAFFAIEAGFAAWFIAANLG